MKLISFLFLIFLNYSISAQIESTSLYFKIPHTDSLATLPSFSEDYIGTYDLNEFGLNKMIVCKDSIYIKTGTPLLLSLKEINSKGYKIIGDKVFGIDKSNGLFCKVVNDTLFTIYYQQDSYFNTKKNDALMQFENGYLMCVKESNGFYSYFYLEKGTNKITIAAVDHEKQMNTIYTFSEIYTQYILGQKTYIINPSIEELIAFKKLSGFNDKQVFMLSKN